MRQTLVAVALFLCACGGEADTAVNETPSPSPTEEFTCEDNVSHLSKKRIAEICGGTVEGTDTSDDDEAVATEGGGIGGGPGRCIPVPRELVDAIEAGLDPGLRLGGVAAVRSKDYVEVWFISGSLEGRGLKGVIGTWMTSSFKSGIGPIYSTGETTVSLSDWEDAGTNDIGASTLDHGYFESQECV